MAAFSGLIRAMYTVFKAPRCYCKNYNFVIPKSILIRYAKHVAGVIIIIILFVSDHARGSIET